MRETFVLLRNEFVFHGYLKKKVLELVVVLIMSITDDACTLIMITVMMESEYQC